MNPLRSGLKKVYSSSVHLRNFAYDAGIVDSLKLQTPVISVGNLTVGGTGKTPVVNWLLGYFRQQQKQTAVVGRNYKAKRKGISRVVADQAQAAFEFGDEPTLTALQNPDVPVFVGPLKWQTAIEAESLVHPDVIIIDDGFQHRALHRDLDLLLIDSTSTFEDYELLPVGRAREGWDSIARAQWVLLTKTNFVDELKIEEWYRLMPPGTKVLELAYRLKADFLNEAGMKALAFAGIARPESFQRSLQNDGLYTLAGFIPYPDHHRYTESDIDFIFKQKSELGADVILTTEKDWVKVKDLGVDMSFVRALGLEVYAMSSQEDFNASLDQLFLR